MNVITQRDHLAAGNIIILININIKIILFPWLCLL